MAEQQQEPKSKGFFESPLGTFIAVALLVLSIYYRFIRKPAAGRRREDMVEEEPEPVVEPIIVGEITAFELEQYDGRDPTKPLMMAIKGNIYDVTKGRSFYGPPDGPYCAFAGK
jgi:membrane-associated progesterone receptor component